MINNKKILALIPARGGSKGIKNKNIIDLCGTPLIAYTISAAKDSAYIDKIVVSTDSEAIRDVAEQYGADVPFFRPPELSTDTATTLDAVLHAINTLEKMGENYDVLVLLQATSPLRTSIDINGALEKYMSENEQGVVAVSEVNDSPILIRTIDQDGKMSKLLETGSTVRRQDMPEFYRVNGSIYVNSINELHEGTSFNDNKIPYIISKTHAVDIDELVDLKCAEFYITANKLI